MLNFKLKKAFYNLWFDPTENQTPYFSFAGELTN